MKDILRLLALTIILIVSVESIGTLTHDSNLQKWKREGGSDGDSFDFTCKDGWSVINIAMAHSG